MSSPTRKLFGRRVIYTDEKNITSQNIRAVLNRARPFHDANRDEIEYLYNYYKGKQPILGRTKLIRPEIANIIIENRANEIVSFKVGYLLGEPLQYVSRSGAPEVTESINTLNEFIFAEDKAYKDKELADWFTIAGTAYRMILPDKRGQEDESPFEIYTLDPRNTFVVYRNHFDKEPMMGVTMTRMEDSTVQYSIYTKNRYYEIKGDKIVEDTPHALGAIPIIEYPANGERLGAFEPVLPLLDAINEVASNRIDGVEQFIQSLLMFKGVNIDSDELMALRDQGGIVVPPDGDVKYLIQELNQMQTQTLVDHMYDTVLTICGMPNRNGGLSTSDTGAAVIMRDGWSAAEGRAKNSEEMFKVSEKKFLRLAIDISNGLKKVDLKLADIDIRFTRRNYENILEKSQVFIMLLSNDMVHPKYAFAQSGLFVDPERAYTESMEYYEKQQAQRTQDLADFAKEELRENEQQEDV